MHETTAADRVEHRVTEDFHEAQAILPPGRRTYEENDDPEEDHHATPREEPPEEEPALGEAPPDPAAAWCDVSGHDVDTRDHMPYREPRGYHPEDVPGDGNCLFHALTTVAGWRGTAAQMRLCVVDYALAHSNDVWSGLPTGQRMQDVFMEERRRYNPRGDAEMNAGRFPSCEVRMGTDRVYGTILEAHVAVMVMGSVKRTQRSGTGSASRAHRGSVCNTSTRAANTSRSRTWCTADCPRVKGDSSVTCGERVSGSVGHAPPLDHRREHPKKMRPPSAASTA